MRPATPDRSSSRWHPSFGVWLDGEQAVARLWAPDARTASLEMTNRVSFSSDVILENDTRFVIPLAREENGFFGGLVPGVAAGTRYRFVLDDDRIIPDPASRFQPEGVHAASEVVDASTFVWRHPSPAPLRLDDQAIYELHVGTFTPPGTFASAAKRLPWLADLGVTAIELMPVAAFAGTRNWGYDGAALFAPSEIYGTPDDLRRLIDEAHGLGLAMVLDVVYNHFGPDGAYAAAASARFFSDRHTSPWGRGINLDGPGAEHVRRFFIENALMWLIEYRFDGLRLDATHALVDESAVPFLAELSGAVRDTVDRDVLLVAEDHRNLRTLLVPRSDAGWGLDAVWVDDFHHSVRRLVAGDDEAYFRDYRGNVEEIVRTIRNGWLYQGEHSIHHDGPRGTDPAGLSLARSVIGLQNHDQIGNRALGERLHHAVDLATWRALSVLLLMAPETPLLFMGQEWAASTPFLYFTDHEPGLGRRVSEGRRDEFRLFRAFGDPERRALIPDPQAPETFLRSTLEWSEIDRPPHAGIVALYRDLLRLRRRLAPEGVTGSVAADRVAAIGDEALFLRRQTHDGHDLLIVVRLKGHGRVSAPPDRQRRASVSILDTEDTRFTVDPTPARVVPADGRVDFSRPGAIIFGSSEMKAGLKTA